MTDEVTIDKAIPDDSEILAEISKRAFDSDVDVGAPGEGGPPGYDSVETHRRNIESKFGEYLKILYNGRIVGGTTAFRISIHHYEIFLVFIDPDFHNKGIGTRSFELIKARYPEAKKWTLDTPVWNVRTKHYYEKLGFIQRGIFRWVPTFDLRAYELITDDTYVEEIVQISDLTEGNEKFIVEGIIESISETREVHSKKDDKTHQVAEVFLKDDSGSIKLVLWNDFIRQVNQGEKVRIETGYVTSFKGEMQLNVSRNGRIVILKV